MPIAILNEKEKHLIVLISISKVYLLRFRYHSIFRQQITIKLLSIWCIFNNSRKELDTE